MGIHSKVAPNSMGTVAFSYPCHSSQLTLPPYLSKVDKNRAATFRALPNKELENNPLSHYVKSDLFSDWSLASVVGVVCSDSGAFCKEQEKQKAQLFDIQIIGLEQEGPLQNGGSYGKN